jgi:uncharacterized protein YdeI (BOF family)
MRLFGSIALIALLGLVTACQVISPATPTSTPLPTPVPVTVRQLIDAEGMLTGHKVAMTGTVILECTSGCWFFLDDGTGKIYIDLATAGLHIPQKVGSRVTLAGDIAGSGGSLHIQAEAVSFPE